MGSGKTTVGTLLARHLGWRFVDLDALIETTSGLNIKEFFERFGEPEFRKLENRLLQAAMRQAAAEPTVLALGGGTFAQPENAELFAAAGVQVVWLDCPVRLLFSRCMTMAGRPLFTSEEQFFALYGQRLPFYQRAHFRVDSSAQPAVVVAEILRLGIAAPSRDSHLIVEPRPS